MITKDEPAQDLIAKSEAFFVLKCSGGELR
jgi:hypothetical protein